MSDLQQVSFDDLPPKIQKTFMKLDWPILNERAIIVAFKQGKAWKLGCLRKDSVELQHNASKYYRIVQ
jgi:hypothetical protein